MFERQYQTNHRWWDERAALHRPTKLYQRHVQALQSGGVSLHKTELAEVGDVTGKRLLHLQCHIGTDTLSWVRRGAIATGVDFSATALQEARKLSEELRLDADFVESNVYDAADKISKKFDVAFSSYGAILWLHDLATWASVISRLLAVGGFFYLIDAHPMLMTLDEEHAGEGDLVRLKYPYFEQTEPIRFSESGSYADESLVTQCNETYEWPHSLAEVISSLLDAGLTLEHFGEHRACPWRALPCCEAGEDGLYRLPSDLRNRVPMLFSLRARKL